MQGVVLLAPLFLIVGLGIAVAVIHQRAIRVEARKPPDLADVRWSAPTGANMRVVLAYDADPLWPWPVWEERMDRQQGDTVPRQPQLRRWSA